MTTSRPLSKVKVRELDHFFTGRLQVVVLIGAEVIKVESPDGDETGTRCHRSETGLGTYFLAINCNKRSIALDLKDGDDLRVAQALSGRADIFIQNFKPGGLARFGLDYESVAARNLAASTAPSADSAVLAERTSQATTSSRVRPA